MAGSHDISTPSVNDDDHFDPTAAADLLTRSRRDARRRFEQQTPMVCVVSAVVVLGVYGTLWLSVRHQDPYLGPSLAVVGWVYGLVAVSIAVSVTAYHRAVRGVRGKSRREDAIAGLAVGLPWMAVYVFNGALHADGWGPALVYGVFDACAPWLVVGTGLAALSAGREQWGRMAGGLSLVVIGTAAAFFGPAGCWGVLGVAGFVALLALAVTRYIQLRRV
jgi:hypothetical protein